MRKLRLAWTLLLLIGLVAPLLALEDIPPAGAGGPTDLRGYVRLVHLAPGVPPVDVYLGDLLFRRALPYAQPTPYLTVMGRSYNMAVRPSGPASTPTPLTVSPVRIYPQFYYTYLIVDTPQGVQVITLYDDPGLPSSGKTRVRFVNVMRYAPPLSLSRGDNVLVRDLPFGQVSNYQTIPASGGEYTIMGGARVLRIPSPPNRARVYTIVTYGDARTPSQVGALVLVDR